MKKEYFSIIVLFLSLLIFTRSNGNPYYFFSSGEKKDYEKLIKLQQETEQNLSQTYDFDIKISSCDNIINALNKFIKKYPDSERTDTAKIGLQSWYLRKFKLTSQLNSLVNELSSNLDKTARDAARHKHKLSKVERCDNISQNKHTEGSKIFMTNVYTVSMKGKIIKKSISNFKITVSGSISIDDRTIFIDDKPQIEDEK
jgi:hypothetical protein